MVRMGLRVILGQSPDIEVVAEARTGRELLEIVDRVETDVAVVDLGGSGGVAAPTKRAARRQRLRSPEKEMSELDGFEAVRTIRVRHPQVRCLVLTVHDESLYMQRAAVAGASGYLLKTELDKGLIEGVMTVADGRAALHPAMTQYLVRELASGRERQEPADQKTLSPREHEVLQAMAHGRSTKQIATELGIGTQTVKTHIAHIYTKMGLRDRTQAVAAALQQGLID